MNLNLRIQEIIAQRQELLPTIQAEERLWDATASSLDRLREAAVALGGARNASAELRDLTRQVEAIIGLPAKAKAALVRIRTRCTRTTINIGVGGAARMGKSTLLQSMTGLGEQQIPTSDTLFCTAIRSQIINVPGDGHAIADFHDEYSLLHEVLLPAMRAAKLDATPSTLDAFLTASLRTTSGTPTAEQDAIITRLGDAQEAIRSLRDELTGCRSRRIELKDLKPYVSYPEDGRKAGPFLAVRNLTIHAPFPSSAVQNIQVMDLPGLGEAGIDLGAMHTKGMEDLCDLTVLVKRPQESNVDWTNTDTTALDAMGRALGSIGDQTHFTVILANTGGIAAERAKLCIERIRRNLHRPFEILECNAKDRTSIAEKTTPDLLDHLAKRLPSMDADIHKAAVKTTADIKEQVRQALAAMTRYLQNNAPQTSSAAQQVQQRARALRSQLANELFKLTDEWKRKGDDKDWHEAIDRAHQEVLAWIGNGCGYGSKAELQEAIFSNINLLKGQPSDVVNAVRIGLTASWERIDDDLDQRIANALRRILELLRTHTGTFVPASGAQDLPSVRAHILQVADRFDGSTAASEDRSLCPGIADCLRRLADLDISYRFHLMPLLLSATKILAPNDLPKVNSPDSAGAFTEALLKKAKEGAAQVAKSLHHSDDRGFEPNRIILAATELFFDALIRAKDAHDEFHAWALSWRDEIWPSVFTAQEADSALVKRVRAAIQEAANSVSGT